MTTNEPLGLDDDLTAADAQPAKDNDGIPYCRTHHCRMKQTSGGKKGAPTAYFGCPVKGCKQTQQMIKSDKPGVVPAQPQECPHCKRRKKVVFCERDERGSSAMMVILKCPECNWRSSGFAVPQLAAAHFARGKPRLEEPEVGAR